MKLHLYIKPSAKRNRIEQRTDGTWLVNVAAPPVDGKANAMLLHFLSEILRLPKSKIMVLKGETSPRKTLLIDMDETTVEQRLHHAAKQ